MKKTFIGALTFVASLSFASSAQAFQLVRSFTSFLDASQEVTPSTSTATGTATLNVLGEDTDSDSIFDVFQLEYNLEVSPELDFSNLITPPGSPFSGDDVVSKLHLHAGAPRGANGVLPFNILTVEPLTGDVSSDIDDDLAFMVDPDGTTKISGLLEASEFVAPVTGFPTFQSIVDELLATPDGQDTSLYWNIHTEGLPDGAIRGQVQAAKTPEPRTVLGLGILASSLGLFSFRRGGRKKF